MRTFALLDCNSFFASCEKVFRPQLAHRPVVVLSNNDGIVIARSPEAKMLGIPMGEAFFKIKGLVRDKKVAVFSSNFSLYGDMSRRVMQTVMQWTPDYEIYSIDEIFLDLTSMNYPDLESLGREMSDTVLRWTGIPVSVGIAPTKTLAKLANETAKKSNTGVCVLMNDEQRDAAMKKFPIGDVWGVGRSLVKRFQELGLKTAYDLSRIEPWWMREHHSIVQEKLVRELRGEHCLELEEAPPPKKSIQCSRSFGDPVESFEELKEAVCSFAAKAAQRMRRQNGAASAIYVHLNTNRFRQNEPCYSNGVARGFRVPTDSTPEIFEAATDCLTKIFRPNLAFKKATVILMDILDAAAVRSQPLLFEVDAERSQARRETESRLMQTTDKINALFGKGTIFFGAEGIQPRWTPHSEHVSPKYTTCWDDLPIVYAK